MCVREGGLSLEVREFFRETTSSDAAAVNVVSAAESPTSPQSVVDVDELIQETAVSSTACRPDVTQHRTVAADAATDEDDAIASYKHASSSPSAPSTWTAFKVRLDYQSPLHVLSTSQHRHFG